MNNENKEYVALYVAIVVICLGISSCTAVVETEREETKRMKIKCND